jgi:dihydropteroate synthase
MGVINVTPDSFSNGGRQISQEEAAAEAIRLVAEGADLLDIGGESSRPGAVQVPLEEELCRVIPAIEAIKAVVTVPISVDTMKPAVAHAALRAGATIVNDISALGEDGAMGRAVVEFDAGVVLMHMQGTPTTMQLDPHYDDVVTEVYDFLARRVEAAERSGVARERIAIDPGIGFGKSSAHNLDLLRNIGRFASLGYAVLIGTSRKGLLGRITGRGITERATASAVSSLAAAVAGANIVRVHDVGVMADTIKVWSAIRGWPTIEDASTKEANRS